MCLDCDKRFSLKSALESAGNELSSQSLIADKFWIKERTGFMCLACDKRFNLTSGLESPGHESSPQSHTEK